MTRYLVPPQLQTYESDTAAVHRRPHTSNRQEVKFYVEYIN